MAGTRRRSDPLGPIDFIITLGMTLLVCLVALFTGVFAWSVTHPDSNVHASIGAWGSDHPCVSVPQQGLTIRSGGDGSAEGESIMNRRPGVTMGTPERFRLCQEQMSATDRSLASVPVVLDLAWTAGFLLLVQRLIARTRRRGLFTHELSRGLRRLGWFVLGGWLLVQVVGATCGVILTSHLVTDFQRWAAWPSYWHWSWATVIGGFGLLTIARIIEATVPLREEVEATV